MTLSSILILTVGHDSTPKCTCVLCMTISRSDTIDHDSISVFICVCVCVLQGGRINVP